MCGVAIRRSCASSGWPSGSARARTRRARRPRSSRAEGRGERVVVDDRRRARAVEEVRGRLHRGQEGGRRRGSRVGPAWRDVQRHEVRPPRQLDQRDRLGSCQPGTLRPPRVVDEYLHAEPACFVNSACPIAPKPTIPSVEPAMRWIGSPLARLQSPAGAHGHSGPRRARARAQARAHARPPRPCSRPARSSPGCRGSRRLVDRDVVRPDAVAADHAKPLARARRRAAVTCAKQVRIASAVAHELDELFLRARRAQAPVWAPTSASTASSIAVSAQVIVGDEHHHSPRAPRPGVRRIRRRAPPRSAAAGCTSRAARTASTDPTLICPPPMPTARSASAASSVSPDRAEITVR